MKSKLSLSRDIFKIIGQLEIEETQWVVKIMILESKISQYLQDK